MKPSEPKRPLITKARLGLVFGILGFLFPFFITLPGLSFAGHLALSLFLLGAAFWLFEPFPIYATSILIIALEAVLLSSQGPVFNSMKLETVHPQSVDSLTWQIPSSALNATGEIVVVEGKAKKTMSVRLLSASGPDAYVVSETLTPETELAADLSSPLISYQPPSYTAFFSTLASPIIMLFLGGFVLAAGAVKYNLDKILTRNLLRPFGKGSFSIMVGLMLITAVLSAFMSNTATTAMMITVVIPIVATLKQVDPLRKAIVMAIPIGANIGGMATPIGTPPNAIVMASLTKQGIALSFTEWIIVVGPIVLIGLALAAVLLHVLFKSETKILDISFKAIGKPKKGANLFYVIFALTVLLWITESVHGIKSAIVAFLPIAGLTLTNRIEKEEIRSLPWEVLWLVAGGIALGVALEETQLTSWLIGQINWASFSTLMLLVVFGAIALAMSNFLSNTVTASLLMPLTISLGSLSSMGAGFDVIVVSLVIALMCSFAMVLPISTPPNAIAMSTGMIESSDMIKIGLIIGIVALAVTLLAATFYFPLLV